MTSIGPLEALAAHWRDEARRYDEDGLLTSAVILRRVAGDLEASLRDWETEPLTLRVAAAELGISYSTAQRWVASGQLRNVGTRYRPRVRRCDLRRPTGPDMAGQVLRTG